MGNTMRKRLAVGIASMALALTALAGCASKDSTAGYTITDGTVETKGAILTVTLDCDPDAGYDWSEAVEGEGVRFDGIKHVTSEDATSAQDIFTFTGTNAGNQTITLTYAAPVAQTDNKAAESAETEGTVTEGQTTDSTAEGLPPDLDEESVEAEGLEPKTVVIKTTTDDSGQFIETHATGSDGLSGSTSGT